MQQLTDDSVGCCLLRPKPVAVSVWVCRFTADLFAEAGTDSRKKILISVFLCYNTIRIINIW